MTPGPQTHRWPTSKDMLGEYLENLTWQEAGGALRRYPVVLLPVGARTKEHGLHLPLNTDWRQAEYLTERIVARREVLVLPTLAYGYYPAFLDYPGSVSVRLEAFRDTVIDICASLGRHGARRFYVLNTGISTLWALEPARLSLAQSGLAMDYSDPAQTRGGVVASLIQQPAGSHADEAETSVMLYIAPEVVKLAHARRDLHVARGSGPLTPDPAALDGLYSPTGAWGDPTLATSEKGAILTEALVERLLAAIDVLAAADYQAPAPRARYLSRPASQ